MSGGQNLEDRIMNERKLIEMLQYRIQRYKEMGNGSMCQNLQSQLQRLISAKTIN